MAKVFFSYSHVDEVLRDRLEVHLSLLKRQGLIESWHDRRITAGSDLDAAISKNLEEANVILLLVSADFIGSEYCYSREMARALERHRENTARVIPVILQPCDWHGAPFGKLLAAPKDGKAVTTWPNQEEAFTDVARQVRYAVEEMHSAAEKVSTSVVQATVPGGKGAVEQPRSSNLRLTKEFSDFDRDHFLHNSFEFMARFFESSLTELAARNEGIQGRYQRIDAHRFSAVIYRNGKSVAECSIRIDSLGGRSQCISFSYNASAPAGSSNEMLQVEFDSQSMYLKPLGMQSYGKHRDQRLSEQGASEHLWALLIEQLQR